MYVKNRTFFKLQLTYSLHINFAGVLLSELVLSHPFIFYNT